jgi:hypothetical protein
VRQAEDKGARSAWRARRPAYARGDFAEAAECYSRAADASIAGRLNAAKALAAGNNYEAAADVLLADRNSGA